MNQRDKLIELLQDMPVGCIEAGEDGDWVEIDYEEIADYLIVNDVKVIPCSVGDIAFIIKNGEIVPAEIISISLTKDTIRFFAQSRRNNRYWTEIFTIEDFGKTVFTTYEEAENGET